MSPVLAVFGRPAAYLEAGRGRPVVLIHGAGGRSAIWTRQLAALGDAARFMALDLPGHGATGGPGRQTVAEYAAWVVGFLDAAGLVRVVLGGHSMGGAIAQAVALAHPERVEGLILVGTGARLRVLPRILELFRDDPPNGPDFVGSLSYSPTTQRERVVEADRALRETPPLVTLGDYLACDRFDVMNEVGALRAPTLVVVGRDDRLTPPKYAAFLAATIPGARLVEVDGAGHFPHLEQPGAVNDAIGAYLLSPP